MWRAALDVSLIRTQTLLVLVCKTLLETRAYVAYFLLSYNILAQMCLSTHMAKMMKGFAAVISGFIHVWIAELSTPKKSEKRFQKSVRRLNHWLGTREQVPIRTGAIFISSKLQPRSRAWVKTYSRGELEKAHITGGEKRWLPGLAPELTTCYLAQWFCEQLGSPGRRNFDTDITQLG